MTRTKMAGNGTSELPPERSRHGGPVSPWPRRVRLFLHGCAALAYTCALIAVISIIALTGATALGTVPVSLALLIGAVVAYATVGLRPVAVAIACAAILVTLIDLHTLAEVLRPYVKFIEDLLPAR